MNCLEKKLIAPSDKYTAELSGVFPQEDRRRFQNTPGGRIAIRLRRTALFRALRCCFRQETRLFGQGAITKICQVDRQFVRLYVNEALVRTVAISPTLATWS